MKILAIVSAILIGLLGLRLVFSSLRNIIMLLKTNHIPHSARQHIFRDAALGILFVILALAMLT